eukprot:snap_masked-scaffold_3-processed-gene-5.16-mRNA-1 protein AED:1.00 eAED:1.00 QI:0/0/0/0/1/1/2/0/92
MLNINYFAHLSRNILWGGHQALTILRLSATCTLAVFPKSWYSIMRSSRGLPKQFQYVGIKARKYPKIYVCCPHRSFYSIMSVNKSKDKMVKF